MSEFDHSGFYPVPANYTDSGRAFRRAVRSAQHCGSGCSCPIDWLSRTSMAASCLAVKGRRYNHHPAGRWGVFALMGIGGESLLQYALHMAAYAKAKRVLHFERIQAIEVEEEKGEQRSSKPKKAKTQRKRAKLAGRQSGQKRCD